MKRRFALLLPLALVAACSDQPQSPVGAEPAAPEAASADRWIVVLKDDDGSRGPSFTRTVAGRTGAEPDRVFSHVLNGFAAELTPAQVEALRSDPNVAYVAPDSEARLFASQTTLYSWGLDRVDQRDLPVNGVYNYNSDGSGVNVYVLDSGVTLGHLDVAGRISYIPNGNNGDFVYDGHGNAADCNGHGTHVAGTAAGTYSGIAKGATVWGGRVVNCSGGGSASMVIAAMDWIAANGQQPGVVNMSLGYGNNAAVKAAAENLVDEGFVVVAAAGNGSYWSGKPLDACTEAPANGAGVIGVGSTTSSDAESSFSNYGSCVDILAPGSSIMSSDMSANNGLITNTGTSMASPHVAGAAAIYLENNPNATPAQVASAITSNASANKISLHRLSKRNGTPNLLLYTANF